MAGDRTGRALARIEAAVRRIEQGAHPPVQGAGTELENRFRELWTRTNSALAEIDGLIGTLEP
jgi:hypothetical protein